jgi:hypothetical protein
MSGPALGGESRCTGEPVSWWRLERFHLGEADREDEGRIAEHLAGCSVCSTCLERIRAEADSALPALDVARRPSTRSSTRWRARMSSALPLFGSFGALAATVALVLGLRGGREVQREPLALESAQTARVKGGAVAFVLVREDGERIAGPTGIYRDGDRFKAVVTCAPGSGISFDLTVDEGGQRTFPLQPAARFSCGNDVPLPGAFRIRGSADENVCLVWSETGPFDRTLEQSAQSGGEWAGLCKRLSPAAR